jgi:HEPN domain-containing protein
MTDLKLEEVRSWLVKAKQDLDAATWLLESPYILYGAVGFHCQQTAEKTLKAYLTLHDQPFEKVHSLVVLVGLCLKLSPDFEELRNAAVTLTPYAVLTRYPGDLPDITSQEARTAVELANQIWDFISTKLPQTVYW